MITPPFQMEDGDQVVPDEGDHLLNVSLASSDSSDSGQSAHSNDRPVRMNRFRQVLPTPPRPPRPPTPTNFNRRATPFSVNVVGMQNRLLHLHKPTLYSPMLPGQPGPPPSPQRVMYAHTPTPTMASIRIGTKEGWNKSLEFPSHC